MDTDNIIIERTHRFGKNDKNNSKPRPIVVQFNNYRDEVKILKNCKKLKNSGLSASENLNGKMFSTIEHEE